MMQGMARFYGLLALIDLALVVVALIDCLSAEAEDIRALPRVAWVFLILLFSPVGPIVWFVAGRPVKITPRRDTWRPGAGFPEVERPRNRAPDDDPEFLAGLAAATRRDDAELLRRWEEDLRRREEQLRGQDARVEEPSAEGRPGERSRDEDGQSTKDS
jgi:hypothetical protein